MNLTDVWNEFEKEILAAVQDPEGIGMFKAVFLAGAVSTSAIFKNADIRTRSDLRKCVRAIEADVRDGMNQLQAEFKTQKKSACRRVAVKR